MPMAKLQMKHQYSLYFFDHAFGRKTPQHHDHSKKINSVFSSSFVMLLIGTNVPCTEINKLRIFALTRLRSFFCSIVFFFY